MTLIAYLGDEKLKEDFLKEISWHQEQDKIIKRTYGEGKGESFRGCAVGCSINSLNRIQNKTYKTDDHSVYEEALGIPETIAMLEDGIFENLPGELSREWPLRFSSAIAVGADLSQVSHKFIVWLLEDVEQYVTDDFPDVIKAIRDVKELYIASLVSGEPIPGSAARSAAWSAARYAAWSAAWSAAESAAWSAARSAAWSEKYIQMADKLIELLEQAPKYEVGCSHE